MTYLAEAQKAVEDFHRATGAGLPDESTIEIRNPALRAALIAEEATESISALGCDVAIYVTAGSDFESDEGRDIYSETRIGKRDLVALADGLADTIYVLLGAAVEAGLELEPIFAEVQRSNMQKAGGPVRADGKRLKPEGWQPPQIGRIIIDQMTSKGQLWEQPV